MRLHSHYHLSDCRFVILLALTAAVYHLIVGIQGFDMYDEGWSLTGFQQIFEAPESVEYLFLYYLTNIVGGGWNIVFGFGGIYAFRILTGIVLTLTAIIVWLMLRQYFNRWCIFIGIMASFVCCYYGMMVFYHNYLTALLATCAGYTLWKALVNDSNKWMFACGIIVGCNVFVRIPNIVLTAFVLLLVPYYIYKRNLQRTLRLLGAFVGGFLTGAAAVVLLMVVFGHLDIFLSAISSGFSATSEQESTHNLSSMIVTYLGVYRTVFTQGVFNNTYTIYLVGTLACLWSVTARRYESGLVYLACISLILMHLLPLGSDFGIQNMGENCIYLAAPFTIGVIIKELQSMKVSHSMRQGFVAVGILFLVLFIIRGGKNIMQQCYFDEGPRREKTFMPETELATTFTTKRNCVELNAIMDALTNYVSPGDTLLCFQNMPMIHYLTRTRPYLRNPWVWSYDPSNMERKFKEAEKRSSSLPVIVREKSMITYWTEYYPDWDNDHAQNTYLHKNKKITLIHRFIQKHHYQVVWENDICQILIVQTARGNHAAH